MATFSIDTHKERVDRLRWDDLDLARFSDHRLDGDALRCLRYMHDVEYHTVCYLREMLMTPAHRDPEITSFLTLWGFEELWHGEGIAAVLAAHGEPAGTARVAGTRNGLGLRDRIRPLLIGGGGWCAGEDFLALHMTWGAINEWTTQAGYARLSAKAGDPTLTALLSRIMRQEGRHIDFYATQASQRLARSRRARRLTRTALRLLWRPVGSGLMAPAETAFLVRYLMGGDEGRRSVARIDRNIDRLPGLSGLGLLERAVEAATAECGRATPLV